MITLSEQLVLIALILSSTWMAAISWYVGLVQYPAFRFVPTEDWKRFHSHHTFWTGVLVGAPMILQIVSTFALFVTPSDQIERWASLVLLLLSVGWTGLVSGPKHTRLLTKDDTLIESLIRTNHVRSIAWTVQAVLATAWLLSQK